MIHTSEEALQTTAIVPYTQPRVIEQNAKTNVCRARKKEKL